MKFEHENEKPEEKNEAEPRNMDQLLDKLNALDETAPDHENQRQVLLEQMKALKEDGEASTENVIEEAQSTSKEKSDTEAEKIREANKLFHEMTNLHFKMLKGLNAKGRFFGMTRFSPREQDELRDKIEGMFERGKNSYTHDEKPRDEKIGELQGIIEDLEKLVEEVDIKI